DRVQRQPAGRSPAAGSEVSTLAAVFLTELAAQAGGTTGRLTAGMEAPPSPDRAIEGVVITPSRLPTVPSPARPTQGGLPEKQPLLAKLLARRLPDPEPELGGQQGAPPCVTCRAGARTSKTWPVASWQFEMTAAPFLLNLCGTHAQEAPAAMVIVRRK